MNKFAVLALATLLLLLLFSSGAAAQRQQQILEIILDRSDEVFSSDEFANVVTDDKGMHINRPLPSRPAQAPLPDHSWAGAAAAAWHRVAPLLQEGWSGARLPALQHIVNTAQLAAALLCGTIGLVVVWKVLAGGGDRDAARPVVVNSTPDVAVASIRQALVAQGSGGISTAGGGGALNFLASKRRQ